MLIIRFFVVVLCFFPFCVENAFSASNCAREKKEEFDVLLEKLKMIDMDLAMEARKAFGIVSSFEEFDTQEPRCTHVNRLLTDMQETIENYK